ncbi:ComEC/Rec2 family competence protein [Arthrobacter sp. NPDC090010]|uniref:ComEC/Rec2 family competence protein n=1 Tax=Arthrobacter sp. NPDC090010 TaxID=3363942 RepID=UPI003817EB6A
MARHRSPADVIRHRLQSRDERIQRQLMNSSRVPDVRLLPTVLAVWVASFALLRREPWTAWGLIAVGGLIVFGWAVLELRRRGQAWPRRCDGPLARARWTGSFGIAGLLLLTCSVTGLARMADPGQQALWDGTSQNRAVPVDLLVLGHPEPGAGAPSEPSTSGGACVRGCRTPVLVTRVMNGTHWHSVLQSATLQCSSDCSQNVTVGTRLRVLARPESRADRPGDLTLRVLTPAETLGAPGRVERLLRGLRIDFLARAARIPGEEGSLLEGMVLGERSRNTPQFTLVMFSTGLGHLTAVSGANCSVVFTMVVLLLRSFRVRRVLAGGFAMSALLAFTALVGPDPSVLRAAVMAGLALSVLVTGHRSRGLPLLCCTVILLLFLEPGLSADLGFALSSAATAGIILGAVPLSLMLGRIMPYGLALTVSVPWAAQWACAPLVVLIQPQLTPYSLLANVLVGPFVAPVTILGTLALVLGPGGSGLSQPVFQAAEFCAGAIWQLAKLCHRLPGAVLDWPPGVLGFGTMALFGLCQAALLWCFAHPARVSATFVRLHGVLRGDSAAR